MKKKLRVIPLATAALLALGMSSVSAKTIYFAEDATGTKLIKVENAETVLKKDNPDSKDALKQFRKAQNSGWKVIVDEDGNTIDWSKALKENKSYASNLVGYPGATPSEAAISGTVNSDGKIEHKIPPVQKTIKSIAPVTITIKSNEQLQNKVPTVDVTYTDGSTAKVAVTWGNVDMTKVGVAQTVQGDVVGTNIKAQATVTVEQASQQVKKANATVQIGGLGSKKVTLTNVDVTGAAKFKVEGSASVKNINETITYFTDAASTKVSILNSADEVIAEGTLTFPTASGAVEFDVTVLKDGGDTGSEVGQEKDAAAAVQIGGLGSKKVTLTNVAVTGAAKFKVEGSASVKNINETITYFTDATSTKVSILNSADEVIAEGTLTFPTASGAVQFKVTVLK